MVSVGTRRGLFVLESSAARDRWALRGPYLKGWQVFHAVVDTRSAPKLHAAANSEVYGATVFSGDVGGKKLEGAKKPPKPPKPPPKSMKFIKKWGISTVQRVWHIEPGRASEKRVLYAGTAPAALFRSEDEGKTWKEVVSLTKHPSRKDWMPGAGGMCLHTIQLDPHDAKRMWVAISAAGAFRTDDGCRTWKSVNKCVAKFAGAPKDPEVGT